MDRNASIPQSLSSREKTILTATAFGHFMSHFNMLVFPAVVLPLTRSLSMPMADVLALSFYQYLLFGITALPWGIMADRKGARPLLFLFYAGAAVCAGLAALFIGKPGAFMLCLAGIGLFSGIYHPTGLGLISKEIRRVSVGMGINGMFGNLGLALAPLFAGLVNFLAGPASVYALVCVMNLAGVAILLFTPSGESRHASERKVADESPVASAFFILLAAMMLGGIAYRGATIVTPAYFELRTPALFGFLTDLFSGKLSPNLVATCITSGIFLVGMVGQYIGGRTAEKMDLRICYLVFHGITIPAAFLMAGAAEIPLVVLALVYFFFLLGMQPVENTLVARLTPPRFHHSAYGSKFVLTFGVGALAVKMVEAIEKSMGLEQVFYALGFVSVSLILVILLLIRSTARNLAVTGRA